MRYAGLVANKVLSGSDMSAPSSYVYPSLQMHAYMLVEPTGLVVNWGQALQNAEACTSMYVSTGQGTQATLPFVALYFPVTQAVHGPPSAPSYPVLQVQFVTAVAATSGS